MGGGGSKSKPEKLPNLKNPYIISKEEFSNYEYDKHISSDKLLSVWTIIYFLLYYFNIVKYNPIILILLAVLFQIFLIFILLYYHIYNSNFTYNTIILFIKLLMIYSFYYMKKPNITVIDVVFTILFIFIYLIYISLYNDNIYDIYMDIIKNNIDKNKGRITSVRYYVNKWL